MSKAPVLVVGLLALGAGAWWVMSSDGIRFQDENRNYRKDWDYYIVVGDPAIGLKIAEGHDSRDAAKRRAELFSDVATTRVITWQNLMDLGVEPTDKDSWT